jgi:hypothetical protein
MEENNPIKFRNQINTTEKNKMTMTLEKIKGMNLQIGDRIELTLNTSISSRLEKNPNNEIYSEIGYFQNIKEKPTPYGRLVYTSRINAGGLENTSEDGGVSIPYIESITILTPKK